MTAVEEEVDDRFAGIDIDSLLNRQSRRPLGLGRKATLYEAPEFIHRFSGEETILEGQSLLLECKVRGFPAPTLRWYKDSDEILDHPRIHVEGDGKGGYSLEIENANKGDEAAYRCRAENIEGACSCFFFLSVKGKKKNKKRQKDSKSSPNKRTVSFPPMFSTIVEKVEEEEKQGKEFELLPPSPMTEFYYALSLKSRQSWPTFLGDWAFTHDSTRSTDSESYDFTSDEEGYRFLDDDDYIDDDDENMDDDDDNEKAYDNEGPPAKRPMFYLDNMNTNSNRTLRDVSPTVDVVLFNSQDSACDPSPAVVKLNDKSNVNDFGDNVQASGYGSCFNLSSNDANLEGNNRENDDCGFDEVSNGSKDIDINTMKLKSESGSDEQHRIPKHKRKLREHCLNVNTKDNSQKCAPSKGESTPPIIFQVWDDGSKTVRTVWNDESSMSREECESTLLFNDSGMSESSGFPKGGSRGSENIQSSNRLLSVTKLRMPKLQVPYRSESDQGVEEFHREPTPIPFFGIDQSTSEGEEPPSFLPIPTIGEFATVRGPRESTPTPFFESDTHQSSPPQVLFQGMSPDDSLCSSPSSLCSLSPSTSPTSHDLPPFPTKEGDASSSSSSRPSTPYYLPGRKFEQQLLAPPDKASNQKSEQMHHPHYYHHLPRTSNKNETEYLATRDIERAQENDNAPYEYQENILELFALSVPVAKYKELNRSTLPDSKMNGSFPGLTALLHTDNKSSASNRQVESQHATTAVKVSTSLHSVVSIESALNTTTKANNSAHVVKRKSYPSNLLTQEQTFRTIDVPFTTSEVSTILSVESGPWVAFPSVAPRCTQMPRESHSAGGSTDRKVPAMSGVMSSSRVDVTQKLPQNPGNVTPLVPAFLSRIPKEETESHTAGPLKINKGTEVKKDVTKSSKFTLIFPRSKRSSSPNQRRGTSQSQAPLAVSEGTEIKDAKTPKHQKSSKILPSFLKPNIFKRVPDTQGNASSSFLEGIVNPSERSAAKILKSSKKKNSATSKDRKLTTLCSPFGPYTSVGCLCVLFVTVFALYVNMGVERFVCYILASYYTFCIMRLLGLLK